jgi:hypothetical protein
VTLVQFPSGSEVPKLTAAIRHLKEQLSACGATVVLSEECLKDLALNAMEAVVRTQQPDESYISCLCRHLDARARFILLWTSSDEPYDRVVWGDLVAVAHKYTLPRVSKQTPQLKASGAR